uniref:Uncharacterized protein LOC104216396 n=1 Tax=Nicotiana sylvestris TaxID=4096 RepID=A0A1U7VEE0_NICSY|nr:PREDICTED: uncharacterized protein LOC104216396 [Nicotiana sylvestris]
MAANNDFTKDITISKMQWKLKVRVVRIWEKPDRFNPGSISPLNWFYKMKREIVNFSEVQTQKQGEITRKYMDIELEDDERNKLSATFWGEFVDQVIPHLLSSNNQPIIVVMQLIKAHKFQDSYSVRNTWNTSKLWINPTFPQSEEFKTRLLSVRDSCSERLTQTISQQSFSVSDELQKGIAEVKTVAQLVQSMQLLPIPKPEIPVMPTPEVPIVPMPELSAIPIPDLPTLAKPYIPAVLKPKLAAMPKVEIPAMPKPDLPNKPKPDNEFLLCSIFSSIMYHKFASIIKMTWVAHMDCQMAVPQPECRRIIVMQNADNELPFFMPLTI